MRSDRPSATAALIAAATLFVAAGRLTKGLVPSDAAKYSRIFLRSLPWTMRICWTSLASGWLRWLATLCQHATVPGLAAHFMLRKRLIESAVVEAIDDGASRVVVVGAGFDTLALRLHRRYPAVEFVELDHPATQVCKSRALADCDLSKNLVLEAFDLCRPAVLPHSSIATRRMRTVFVLEGLLMYLDTKLNEALLRSLTANGHAQDRLVFTVMEPVDGRIDFHNATPLVRHVLRLWREPFKSGLPREEFASYLQALGFVARSIATTSDDVDQPSGPTNRFTVARGELICVADRAIAAD